MNRIAVGLIVALALTAPVTAGAQDRASELEARQAARVAELLKRRGGEEAMSWRDPSALGCPTAPFGTAGAAGALGSINCWNPFLPPLRPGYRLPNPYSDWAALWGRGWLDNTAIPPYHRFQYRFFPETLPDPTRDGYIVPPPVATPGWQAAPVAPGYGRTQACAQIELEYVDGETETLLVTLPALGAITTQALGAVIRERLSMGGGVTLRGIDGYVYPLPAADGIRRLVVTDC
jgi:hypothetical protein